MNTSKYIELDDLKKYHSRFLENVSNMDDILEMFWENNTSILTINDYGSIDLLPNLDESSIPENIIIPEELQGITCTGVADNLVKNANVRRIYFPKTITSGLYYGNSLSYINSLKEIYVDACASLSTYAFRNFIGLTDVYLSDNVTAVGDSAFTGCTSLKNITLSKLLHKISNNAFYGCSSLKSIDIPDSVSVVGSNSFNGCTSLEKIKFPKYLIEISASAFRECTSLKNIELPDMLKTIGGYVFYHCTSLEKIQIPDSVTSMASYTFTGCASLKTAIIGDSIKTLSNTFADCTALESVVLPKALTTINASFYNCPSLTSISISEENLNFTAENGILFNKDKTTIVSWSGASGSIVVPSSVIRLTEGCFFRDINLTQIDLVNVTSIPDRAFEGCSNLSNVTLSNQTAVIGYRSFYGCTSLHHITIPETVTTILNETFRASGLEEIVIPDSCTRVDDSSFANCENLHTVTIGAGLTSVYKTWFSYSPNLTTLIMKRLTPPTIYGTNPFETVQAIYVPTSAVETYKTNSTWSRFADIIQAIE